MSSTILFKPTPSYINMTVQTTIRYVHNDFRLNVQTKRYQFNKKINKYVRKCIKMMERRTERNAILNKNIFICFADVSFSIVKYSTVINWIEEKYEIYWRILAKIQVRFEINSNKKHINRIPWFSIYEFRRGEILIALHISKNNNRIEIAFILFSRKRKQKNEIVIKFASRTRSGWVCRINPDPVIFNQAHFPPAFFIFISKHTLAQKGFRFVYLFFAAFPRLFRRRNSEWRF